MSTCPWCHSDRQRLVYKVKDHFLSQEEFEIFACLDCDFVHTEPRPTPDKIGAYYQSDEYYSHQENKKGFIPKIYEAVKSVNLKNKVRLSLRGLPKGSVLDIGCGVGDYLLQARKVGWSIQGVEPSEDARKIAYKRLGFTPLMPAETSSLPDASFDVITMWHVLEHVDDLRWQVAEIQRLLKPGGRLVLALPNYLSFDCQYYKEYWAAWDVPRHLNHFHISSLEYIFKPVHIDLVELDKLRWDAYYISYLSEKYKGHSLPLLRGALIGLWSNLHALRDNEYSSMVYRFIKDDHK